MNQSRAVILAATFVVGAAVAAQADAAIVYGTFGAGTAAPGATLDNPSYVTTFNGRFSYDSALPRGSLTAVVERADQTFLLTGGSVTVRSGEGPGTGTGGDSLELRVVNAPFNGRGEGSFYGASLELSLAPVAQTRFLSNGASYEQDFSLDINDDPNRTLRANDGYIRFIADQLTPTGGATSLTFGGSELITYFTISTTDVPEPASLAVFGCGLLGLVAARRRAV